MAGFCIQSTRESDVVSYGYPCAFLLESSPSSWETTGCSSLFWSSRRFCHHFAGRGRGLWLSFSASSNVPHGRQKPTRAATTASFQRSFSLKEGGIHHGFSAAGTCDFQWTYEKLFILPANKPWLLQQSKKVSNGTDTKMLKIIFFRDSCLMY